MIMGMSARDFVSLCVVAALLLCVLCTWVLALGYFAIRLVIEFDCVRALLLRLYFARVWRRQKRRAIRP